MERTNNHTNNHHTSTRDVQESKIQVKPRAPGNGKGKMPITYTQLKEDPDVVLRYWLKMEHRKIYKTRDSRDWELRLDGDGTLSIDNWNVAGVTAPSIQELQDYVDDLATPREDTDINDIEDIQPSYDLLEKMLSRMYELEHGYSIPSKAQLKNYIKDFGKTKLQRGLL